MGNKMLENLRTKTVHPFLQKEMFGSLQTYTRHKNSMDKHLWCIVSLLCIQEGLN